MFFCLFVYLVWFLFPSGLHEQHFIWQWEDRLLWDSCRWSGGGAKLEWTEWSSQSHDQHPHHRPRDSGEKVGHVLVKEAEHLNLLCVFFKILILSSCCCSSAVQISRHFRAVLSAARLRRCREILWWRGCDAETSVQEQGGSVCTDREAINPPLWPPG